MREAREVACRSLSDAGYRSLSNPRLGCTGARVSGVDEIGARSLGQDTLKALMTALHCEYGHLL